jgi:hypothetical protein
MSKPVRELASYQEALELPERDPEWYGFTVVDALNWLTHLRNEGLNTPDTDWRLAQCEKVYAELAKGPRP